MKTECLLLYRCFATSQHLKYSRGKPSWTSVGSGRIAFAEQNRKTPLLLQNTSTPSTRWTRIMFSSGAIVGKQTVNMERRDEDL